MTQEHTPPSQPPKLLNQVHDRLRVKHYSLRTEQVYVDWIKRFIRFHDKRHPKDMGGQEITAILTYLAVDKHVAASTQKSSARGIGTPLYGASVTRTF